MKASATVKTEEKPKSRQDAGATRGTEESGVVDEVAMVGGGEFQNGNRRKINFWLSAEGKGVSEFGARKCGGQRSCRPFVLIMICKC
jgi:hypothetical protein